MQTSDRTALWYPSAERIAASAMQRFRDELAAEGVIGPEPDALHNYSVERPADFWGRVFDRAVRGGDGAGAAFTQALVEVPGPPGASFFPGAQVSYAAQLLAGAELAGADQVALVYRREDGSRLEWTWRRLRAEVAACAAQLRLLDVGAGDVVGGWLPNCPQAVATMLAANAIGAVYTSASPDFGPTALADRFAQLRPKVLVVPDAYRYGGKTHPRLPLVGQIAEAIDSLVAVIVVPEREPEPDLSGLTGRVGPQVLDWPAAAAEDDGIALDFHRAAYDDPGFVLYSSGTTGKPKAIVHSALGLLVKHWTEHVLHSDIRPGDRVFYFTTCGWMMWNWLVGALAAGATIVLYDGSPLFPDPGALWRLAAEEGVSFFGTSAKYLDSCRRAGVDPLAEGLTSALRTVASTGSPLAAQDYRFVYERVSPDVHLASISGGTDICGCFVLGDPTRPVYAGEIQGPALGADVDVLAADGSSLRGAPGEQGELVCRSVLPSMPLTFAGADGAERYRASYFERFEGMWTHGDFAEWTEHGGIVISGRSDATLNAGGVRIGTAEIYRQVEQVPGVMEALAVGEAHDGDTRIVLFVRLLPGVQLDDDLRAAIRIRLRTHASPRHVPAVILSADDFPRTRSGKLAELAVADVVNGRAVRNTHALANPEVLADFRAATATADPG
ncbi:MAG: acetoacetate--CoA ligase [Actinobacteria bacterium]|nr:MAG: acetoacetate--CoA ligase [Actinomycetota bacterium]